MRRRLALALALAMLLLTTAVHAEEPPGRMSMKEAMAAAVKAAEAGDRKTLAELAAQDLPDPWRVADDLYHLGHVDAAKALAAEAKAPAVQKLAAYIAGLANAPKAHDAHDIVAKASAAWAAQDMPGVIEATASVKEPKSVSATFAVYMRAIAYRSLRKPAEASVAYETSGAAAEAIGWMVQARACYQDAGFNAIYANQLERGRALWRRAIAAGRAIGQEQSALLLEINLASTYRQSGDVAAARKAFEAVHDRAKAKGVLLLAARAHEQWGQMERDQGELAEALRLQEDAHAIYEKIGSEVDAARVASAIGSTYMSIGENERGIKRMRAALVVQQRLKDHPEVAITLGNLGLAYLRDEELTKALETFTELLALFRAAGPRGRWDVARTLTNIGLTHFKGGQWDQSIASLTEALAIREQLGDGPGSVTTRSALASSLRARGSRAQARAQYEALLAALKEYPNPERQVRGLMGLAGIELDEGDTADAVAHASKAVDLMGRMAVGLAEGQSARRSDAFLELFLIGVDASVAEDDASALAWFLERGRAGSMRAALGSRDALESATIAPELLARLAEARDAEQKAYAALKRAQRRRMPMRAYKARRDAWRKARDETQAVVERTEREAKRAADLTVTEVDGIGEIAARLGADEALVLYGLGRSRHVALVIRQKGHRIVPLGASTKILEATEALLEEDKGVDPAGVAALRRLLIEPLALAEDVRRVLISPVDELGFVPFSLLLPTRDVVYVPSGSTHGALAAAGVSGGTKVLAIGDPEYGGRLPRLEATRVEVNAVGDVKALGKDASETAVAGLVARETRWRAIHFACHGLVDVEDGKRSSLALTADAQNDGQLTGLEILRMSMPADLVVLSACETGKGRVSRTEGIVGLTRAFMFAGAPRVLCSLWKVDDEATRALMTKFYALWKPGTSAATALRGAQAHVRAQEGWEHPYYWAAWVLWGVP